MIVLSPHLDDAVLSIGQILAAHPGATILTALAGAPTVPLAHYDATRGFPSSEEAVAARRIEDEQACAVLRATPVHLDFLDRQYGQSIDVPKLVHAIREHFGAGPLFVPLGLAHPDHELVGRCGRAAARAHPTQDLYAYEELPGRVLWPEEVPAALDRARLEGWKPERTQCESGPRTIKAAAIACYRSQFDDLADPTFYVPERIWQLRWDGGSQ